MGLASEFCPLAKLTASINLANVLILVNLAPVKSFPGVVSFTVKRIAEILKPSTELPTLQQLLTNNFGRGNCPF